LPALPRRETLALRIYGARHDIDSSVISVFRRSCSLDRDRGRQRRNVAAAMAVADFAARAVRDFVEQADDERWFQLLTIIRKAENPGVAAIQAILGWVAADA
jgi:hypothetical protein